MDKNKYPTAFLLVISIALYIMYGDMFSLNKIDFSAYQEVCEKYNTAKKGIYSNAEVKSLVNKVNYILPEDISAINEPLKKDLKLCANELTKKLSH